MKLIKILIPFVIVLTGLLYFYTSNNTIIEKDINPKAEKLVEILTKISGEQKIELFNFTKTTLKNEAALTNNFDEITQILNALDVKRVVFLKSGDYFKGTFIIDSFNLGSSWYFVYSEDGYTEEEQVDSIEDAIKNNKQEYYHYCEKLNQNYWFICSNNA
ncbi:hypothetical protein [Sessilibacter corallicola]|uniref:hypothetical protein n=1 Tax=Sessilibacter corallicola TaxID=2904075 RepID=UPI001E5B945A|nr:hypothetical protein [Sessilibacter corallicola]MCE2030060.1 hypothetical protein [Sessilibacter corallicola]